MDKRLMAALFGVLLAVPSACSKEVYYDYEDPQLMLFEVDRIQPNSECPRGGQVVRFGLDTSRDGKLDVSEITNTEYVCDGANGKASYVMVTEIVSGKVCPYGGQQIDIGIDSNQDKKLTGDEIQSTHYVCYDSRSEGWSQMSSLDSFGNFTCGHLNNNDVACWGVSVDGTEETSAPTIVTGISKANKVSAGCILVHDGTVECWDGIDASPRKIPNILTATDITGNQAGHACALLADKTAVCWGSNDEGQLGNGTLISSKNPVGVFELGGKRLQDISSIRVGPKHTCAIVGSSKKIACWGNNGTRQLGAATNAARSVGAVYIQDVYGTDVTGAAQVALGDGHTCALFERDGKVKCWGSNDSGQLGSTRTMGSVVSDMSAVSIDGNEVTRARGVYCGGSFTCVHTADGSVYCFGDNTYDQLGARTKGLQSAKPVAVVKAEDGSTLDNVSSLTLGRYHGCALRDDASVYCWGREAHGQLGNAKTRDYERYSTLPVKFDGFAGGVSDTLSLGSNHGCQLLGDKTVSCWGLNNAGQMGEENGNSWLFSASPLPVMETTSAASVVSSPIASHSCAILEDGTLSCWGANASGQLGDGEPTSWKTPRKVLKYKADGEIEDVLLSSVTAVSTGSAHTCAVISTDAMSGKTRVDCWGAGASGQTGSAAFEDALLPTEVPGSADLKFSAVASGSAFNCAIASGTVRCWGEGSDGQLGNGATAKSAAIVQASGLASISKIGAGHAHACALDQNGKMSCWGNNAYGQLGDGKTASRSTPGAISGFDAKNVTGMAVGHFHSCAIVKDSSSNSGKEANVWCWGNNAYGQLGNGTRNNSSVPVKVRGLPASAASISCGAGHTCAVLTTGDAWCWGRNEYGQIGKTAGQLGAVPGALMP